MPKSTVPTVVGKRKKIPKKIFESMSATEHNALLRKKIAEETKPTPKNVTKSHLNPPDSHIEFILNAKRGDRTNFGGKDVEVVKCDENNVYLRRLIFGKRGKDGKRGKEYFGEKLKPIQRPKSPLPCDAIVGSVYWVVVLKCVERIFYRARVVAVIDDRTFKVKLELHKVKSFSKGVKTIKHNGTFDPNFLQPITFIPRRLHLPGKDLPNQIINARSHVNNNIKNSNPKTFSTRSGKIYTPFTLDKNNTNVTDRSTNNNNDLIAVDGDDINAEKTIIAGFTVTSFDAVPTKNGRSSSFSSLGISSSNSRSSGQDSGIKVMVNQEEKKKTHVLFEGANRLEKDQSKTSAEKKKKWTSHVLLRGIQLQQKSQNNNQQIVNKKQKIIKLRAKIKEYSDNNCTSINADKITSSTPTIATATTTTTTTDTITTIEAAAAVPEKSVDDKYIEPFEQQKKYKKKEKETEKHSRDSGNNGVKFDRSQSKERCSDSDPNNNEHRIKKIKLNSWSPPVNSWNSDCSSCYENGISANHCRNVMHHISPNSPVTSPNIPGDNKNVNVNNIGIINSTNIRVLLSPRLTTAGRDLLTAEAGMVIFNTTTNKHQGYDGTNWNDFY